MLAAKEAFAAALGLETMAGGGNLTRAEETLEILEGTLNRLNPVLEEFGRQAVR